MRAFEALTVRVDELPALIEAGFAETVTAGVAVEVPLWTELHPAANRSSQKPAVYFMNWCGNNREDHISSKSSSGRGRA